MATVLSVFSELFSEWWFSVSIRGSTQCLVWTQHATMKVLLHYEDIDDIELYKSLKITLPKSWRTGPTQRLLDQFVEFYNAAFANNQLRSNEMHLSIRKTVNEKSQMEPLASDATVVDVLTDYCKSRSWLNNATHMRTLVNVSPVDKITSATKIRIFGQRRRG